MNTEDAGRVSQGCRKAIEGSIRTARRAGIQADRPATTASSVTATPKAVGVQGVTPNRNDVRRRVSQTAQATPATMPAREYPSCVVTIIQTSVRGLAPIANRIPISLVRWRTAYVVTP